MHKYLVQTQKNSPIFSIEQKKIRSNPKINLASIILKFKIRNQILSFVRLLIFHKGYNGEFWDEKIGYKSNETRSEICFWTQFDKNNFKFDGVQGWWHFQW